MTTLKLRKWDSAEHLNTDEDMAAYLEACLQEAGDDAAFIAKALGNIARAKGMTQLSKDTGLGREGFVWRGQPQFCDDFEGDPCLGFEVSSAPPLT